MSAAAGEQGYNDTAATSELIIYPWSPTDANNQILNDFDVIWGPPEYPPEEKPKRKSKWLLKQMARRGHQP
ncbi:MAG: hypothetical protein V3S09_04690 [Candidatus Bathyarchaeia archaeon]